MLKESKGAKKAAKGRTRRAGSKKKAETTAAADTAPEETSTNE